MNKNNVKTGIAYWTEFQISTEFYEGQLLQSPATLEETREKGRRVRRGRGRGRGRGIRDRDTYIHIYIYIYMHTVFYVCLSCHVTRFNFGH
jgi:hypothetical protein